MSTTTMSLEKAKPSLPTAVAGIIQPLIPNLRGLLPADMPMEQFRAALYLELTGRPDLYDCTPESLRECVIKSATYGLLPGRDCHYLPFRNRRAGGKKTATYIPNYQGIILALERSGKVRRAFAHPVYEGDVWEFDMFKDRPVHQPAVTVGRPQGALLFYYGAVLLKDGTCHFEVLTLEDIASVKKRAPAHEDGPWVTDPVMMARKTAIKRVAKYVRLTDALAEMFAEATQRELADIPPARHQQNIIDLFGDDAGAAPSPQEGPQEPRQATHASWVVSPEGVTPAPAQAPVSSPPTSPPPTPDADPAATQAVREAIEQAQIAQGLTSQQRMAWRGTRVRAHKARSFAHLPLAVLEGLLADLQAEALIQEDPTPAPTPPAEDATDAPTWRAELQQHAADLRACVDESQSEALRQRVATLTAQALDLAADPDATEAQGWAMSQALAALGTELAGELDLPF